MLKYVIKQRSVSLLYTIHPNPLVIEVLNNSVNLKAIFNILDINNALALCRFRTTNNSLNKETGRLQKTFRQNRLCFFVTRIV